jgi:superfamily II DNA or RNA helicase
VIQSLVRNGTVDDGIAGYGQLIVDECHHLPARSFEQVARQAKARFVVGLSATVARKDGHHPIVFMQCGPVRHRVDARAQAAVRPFEHRVLVRTTDFQPLQPPEADRRLEFQALYRALIEDEARTQRICEDVVSCVRAGRSPLVLTERNEHLDRLAQGLEPHVRHLVVLRAGMGRKEREATSGRLAAIPRAEERVVLATGKLVGEGFDDARLDTLFLTLPVSWRGTVAQYAGRLHRISERQARGADLRLCRPGRADAGAHVRPALPRLPGHRIHARAAGQRRAGVARRCRPAGRSGLEARPRWQRAAPRARRRGHAARQPVPSRDPDGARGH